MVGPVTIRRARVEDWPAIARLMAASWQHAYAPFLPADILSDLPERFAAKWKDHAAGPGDLVMVAEGDGGLLGFAAFLAADPMYLDNLHVRPDLRGGGIGRQLLAGCVAPLRVMGARRAELTVIERNAAARAFYDRMGGRIAARETASLFDTPLDVLRVRWDDIGAWRQLETATLS